MDFWSRTDVKETEKLAIQMVSKVLSEYLVRCLGIDQKYMGTLMINPDGGMQVVRMSDGHDFYIGFAIGEEDYELNLTLPPEDRDFVVKAIRAHMGLLDAYCSRYITGALKRRLGTPTRDHLGNVMFTKHTNCKHRIVICAGFAEPEPT
jgi:hypothetical protein